ncbi:TPA: hypothetical protein I8Y04_000556 [Raoultella planticola]|uniref:hypothetical protein n=1 Tax=Raoultella planticola TaxID=575 RepID=UPI001A1DF985|nr:hypothetical protein [Raoultella planticola]
MRNAQKRQQGAESSGGGGAEGSAEVIVEGIVEETKKALPEQRLMRDYFTC